MLVNEMLHYGTQPHCLRRAVHVRHSKPEIWFVRERFLLEKLAMNQIETDQASKPSWTSTAVESLRKKTAKRNQTIGSKLKREVTSGPFLEKRQSANNSNKVWDELYFWSGGTYKGPKKVQFSQLEPILSQNEIYRQPH